MGFLSGEDRAAFVGHVLSSRRTWTGEGEQSTCRASVSRALSVASLRATAARRDEREGRGATPCRLVATPPRVRVSSVVCALSPPSPARILCTDNGGVARAPCLPTRAPSPNGRPHTPRELHGCDSSQHTAIHVPLEPHGSHRPCLFGGTVRLRAPPSPRYSQGWSFQQGRVRFTRPRSGCRQSSPADGRSWRCPGPQTG